MSDNPNHQSILTTLAYHAQADAGIKLSTHEVKDLLIEIKSFGVDLDRPTASEADVIPALVIGLTAQHLQTWVDRPETYWFTRLVAEIGELAEALNGRHEHAPELELAEIASIAANWLRHRQDASIPKG